MLFFNLSVQNCGDRPQVVNGDYVSVSQAQPYVSDDQLEVQCRKTLSLFLLQIFFANTVFLFSIRVRLVNV